MGRDSYQGLRLSVLKDYLLSETNETEYVKMDQIIEHLNGQGIPAERKAVYRDIEMLQSFYHK